MFHIGGDGAISEAGGEAKLKSFVTNSRATFLIMIPNFAVTIQCMVQHNRTPPKHVGVVVMNIGPGILPTYTGMSERPSQLA